MPNTLIKKHIIRFSETGQDGKVRIPAILNLVQDTTLEHSRNQKTSIFDLSEKNLTWVMTNFWLQITKRPAFNDTVVSETFHSPLRKLYDLRQFCVRDLNGHTLFTAKAAMILIHKKSRRPQRLDKHFSDSFFDHPGRIDFSFSKLIPCDSYEFSRRFKPGFNEIDFNNHVNNTVYSNWAVETIPDDYKYTHRLRELEVNFREESFLGDKISSQANIKEEDSGIRCDHMISQRDSNNKIAFLNTVWEKR